MKVRERRARDKEMWREVMVGLPLETAMEKGLTMRRLKNLWESQDGWDAKTLPEFIETHWKAEWKKAMEQEAQAALMPWTKKKGNVVENVAEIASE
jgi:hypothetical protein